MKKQLDEVKKLQKIAGIISEGLGKSSDTQKVQKAAQAISKLRQFPSFGYAELYKVLTAARLSPEEFIDAADMAGLEYETEILDNNGNAEFSIADDNYNDFRKPITFVGGKLERIDLRVR